MRFIVNSTTTLGEALKARRKQLKKTIKGCASECKLTDTTIMNIEKGRGGVRTDTLLAYVQTIGVTVEVVVPDHKEVIQ